jgi:hypothetical protein
LSEAAQEMEAREEAEKQRYQQRIADLEQRTAARKNGNS